MDESINQGANPELYKYLVETYGNDDGTKIQILDNGGYYLTGVHSDNSEHTDNEIYIPPTVGTDTNVSMISYYPGGGGIQDDSVEWQNKILSDNPPNAIITLSSYSHQSTDIMEIGYAIAEENGSNVTNVVLGTYSASGNCCTELMDTFVGNHLDVTSTLVIADGSINRSFVGQNMIDQQTQIIAISGAPGIYWHNEIKYSVGQLDGLGYNVKVLQTSDAPPNSDSHYLSNYDSINAGIHEYILGLCDKIDPEIMHLCDYKLYSYEDGEYILVGDGKDFSSIRQESLNSGYTLIKLYENPFVSGTVASDMYTISQSILNLRTHIVNNTIQVPSCISTSSIPVCFSNVQTSLISISNDLNNTIYKETNIIASIAQTFYDMDRERTEAANMLSDAGNTSLIKTEYQSILNNILKTDITNEINFENFMFDPEFHISGSFGKLCISDINSMLNGNSLSGILHENFENERLSARNTKNELDNMNSIITSSNNFQGEIWAQVSSKLTEYSELMDTRIEVADILETAMVEALTLLKDYMGDYEELDDSKLPELRNAAKNLKREIMNVQQIIDATHTKIYTETLEDGSTKFIQVREYVYSAGARKKAMQFIYTAKTALVIIEKEIARLEGLPIILAQAEQIVNNALNDVYTKYGIKVSSLVTGKESSYIPPINTSYVVSSTPSNIHWSYQRDIPDDKLDIGKFYLNSDLVNRYGGSYNDYLNGVERENNPMFNTDIEDNGIGPGESIDDKIFDEDIGSLLDKISTESDDETVNE